MPPVNDKIKSCRQSNKMCNWLIQNLFQLSKTMKMEKGFRNQMHWMAVYLLSSCRKKIKLNLFISNNMNKW